MAEFWPRLLVPSDGAFNRSARPRRCDARPTVRAGKATLPPALGAPPLQRRQARAKILTVTASPELGSVAARQTTFFKRPRGWLSLEQLPRIYVL